MTACIRHIKIKKSIKYLTSPAHCLEYCWSIKDSLSRYCTLLLGLLYVAKDQAGVFISSLIENYLRLGALQGKSQLVDNISEAQTCFYVLQAIMYMRSVNHFFN